MPDKALVKFQKTVSNMDIDEDIGAKMLTFIEAESRLAYIKAEKDSPEFLEEIQTCKEKFDEEHLKIWGECFEQADLFHYHAHTTARNLSIYMVERKADGYDVDEPLYKAMQSLYNRNFRIYLEIFSLLQNGHAEAGHSRWRTMYELVCVMDFIINSPDDKSKLALSYLENNDTKGGNEHNWASIDSRLVTKKGKQSKKVRFTDIENASTFLSDDLRVAYKSASSFVHSAPSGTFTRIGLETGHSGMSIVALYTANTLLKSVELLCDTDTGYLDGIVSVAMLDKQCYDVCKKFQEIERKYFPQIFNKEDTPCQSAPKK